MTFEIDQSFDLQVTKDEQSENDSIRRAGRSKNLITKEVGNGITSYRFKNPI